MASDATSQSNPADDAATGDLSPLAQPPRAAYIHVPFCAHRCGYCNFTLVAGRDDLIPAYLTAIEKELSFLQGPHELDTLFFGGGTPSQLPGDQLRRLFAIVEKTFCLAAGGELSIEVNPADLNQEKADVLQAAGVTRISLGSQSLDAKTLKVLERDHTPDDVIYALELARTFADSVSLDLIFAAPRQSLTDWNRELQAMLDLQPEHVSTYGLTYELGTSFWSRLKKQALTEVAEDLQSEMYLQAIKSVTAAGYEHYEVSNFAQPGHRCRHNEVYWAGQHYFAAGPSAARYIDGVRSTNHRSTFTWLKRLQEGLSPVAESEELGPEDRARELLVLGLRRIDGIRYQKFEQAAGFTAQRLLQGVLADWSRMGLVDADDEGIRLTTAGLLVSDRLWGDLLRV